MKNTFRAMVLSASALAFVTAAPTFSAQIFAQDAAAQCASPDRDKLYEQDFKTNFPSKNPVQQREIALNAAEKYLQQYSSCTDNAEVVTYLKNWVSKNKPVIEQEKLYGPFNTAYTANDTPGLFTAGKGILTAQPDNLAVLLILFDKGYLSAQNKVDTYNNDTISYAKKAIELINSGKTPEGGKYGSFASKDEALAWANYTIGYVNATRLNNKPEAAKYFYQSTLPNSDLKKSYYPYLQIGDMYLDMYTKAAEEYNAKKDDAAVDDATKNQLAGTWKAYADRAAEFYARAYNAAKADPKTKPTTTSGILSTLTQIYKLRNANSTTTAEAFAATFNTKPVTDPSTAITPVIEADTAANASATASISSSGASSEGSTRTASAGQANGSGIGRANGSATGRAAGSAATTTTTTTTKKPAPAPRKKS